MEQQSVDSSALQELVVECVEGQLRISVGVKAFANALAAGSHGMRKLEVIDAKAFAEEVIKELTQAREQGGTLVHRMLDHAAGLAADRYAHWIEVSPPPAYPTPGYTEFIDKHRPTPYIPTGHYDDE